MKNQEFQAVLQSLPQSFDIIVNGSPDFDVKGHFEIKDGAAKGVIHITDIFEAKLENRKKSFVKDKKVLPAKQLNEKQSDKEKKAYKTYTPGEKERIIEDIQNGLSFKEINEKYNISLQTYNRRKKEYKTQPANEPDNKSDKHKKTGFNSTPISDADRIKIAEDIKLGLYSRQILKKYHINIPTLAAIKKSIKEENTSPDTAGSEDDPKAVKKRLDYGRSINSGSDKVPACGMLKGINSSSAATSVDINKVQETIVKAALNKFKPAKNPAVRNWQADMITRGL